MKEVDAVILCTPTPMHASQALACLAAGKHVQVEIPLCDRLADGQAVVAAAARQRQDRDVRPHAAVQPEPPVGAPADLTGELNIQQMDVQTYFFRRTNMNALGQPRSWTDHLLWHHAAHTVDLFAYQTRSRIVKANAIQGPIHPTLGIAMDMSIQLAAENGAICTLSLSFNNDGPLGTFFRYIGDTGTYIARYDDLVNGKEEKIDVSKVARVDERHRAAGPRVLRGDPRRPRAQRERRAGLALLRGAAPAGTAARVTSGSNPAGVSVDLLNDSAGAPPPSLLGSPSSGWPELAGSGPPRTRGENALYGARGRRKRPFVTR